MQSMLGVGVFVFIMAAGRVFTACVFVVAPLGSKTMAATAALLHTQGGGGQTLFSTDADT